MRPDGCVHKWQIDNKNVGTCSLCGEIRQFPLEKGGEPAVLKQGNRSDKKYRRKSTTRINNFKRHRYYEDNKDAIIADLSALGRRATCKKWGIPQPSILYLEGRWLTEEHRARIFNDGPELPPQTPQGVAVSRNGRLPHFPEFSGTWDASVQLEWLEVYESLATKQGGKS
jgi:hypothetical protein